MAGEWPEISLGDLIDVKHGFAFQGEFIHDEPCGDVLLTPGNFAIGGGFKGDKFKYFNGPVPHDFVLAEGELLVTMTDLSKQSDTLGLPAFVPSRSDGRRYLHNQRLGKVLVKDKRAIDTRYLHYLMRSTGYRHEVLASATGTTVKHTSPERIRRFRFSRPPLPEQRAIAHILGTLDDKIELNRRMSETLEAMARALFKSWFVDFDPVRWKMERKGAKAQSRNENKTSLASSRLGDFALPPALADLFPDSFEDSELGEIPRGWAVGALLDLLDFLEGPGLRNWQYLDEGIKFLNIRCISDGDIDIAKANCISHEEFKERYLHFALQTDDIVISTSGTLGRLAVVRDDHLPIMLNTSIIRFRGLGAVGLTYVWGFLQSVYFISEMQALASGSVQLNFGPMHLRQISVILPSDEVLYEFESIAQPLLRKSLNLRKESRTLAALRDALLPKLISGELRVKDAEKIIEREDAMTQGRKGEKS